MIVPFCSGVKSTTADRVIKIKMKKKKDKRSGDVGRAHDASGDRTTCSLAACHSTWVSSHMYCSRDASGVRF